MRPITLLALRDLHEGRRVNSSRYRARHDPTSRSRIRHGNGLTALALPERPSAAEGELRELRAKVDPETLAPALLETLARPPSLLPLRMMSGPLSTLDPTVCAPDPSS